MNKTVSNISLIKERLQPQYLGEMGHKIIVCNTQSKVRQHKNNNSS